MKSIAFLAALFITAGPHLHAADPARRRLDAALADRRPGDAPALIADARKAADMLGWRPTRSLDAILADAWRWHGEVEPALFG